MKLFEKNELMLLSKLIVVRIQDTLDDLEKSLHINALIICSDRPQRKGLLFKKNKNIFQLSHANELPDKLNEFSSLKFLWGSIQNSLLPLQHMKPGMKAHLAAARFMNYLFHADARLWALPCCQTLIPALLLHYNWDTSRGDMYI